jgi:hypothetical protein
MRIWQRGPVKKQLGANVEIVGTQSNRHEEDEGKMQEEEQKDA